MATNLSNKQLMQNVLSLRAEGLLSFDQTRELAEKLTSTPEEMDRLNDSHAEQVYLIEQATIDTITENLDTWFK